MSSNNMPTIRNVSKSCYYMKPFKVAVNLHFEKQCRKSDFECFWVMKWRYFHLNNQKFDICKSIPKLFCILTTYRTMFYLHDLTSYIIS